MRPFERREIAGKLGLKLSPDSKVVARQYDVALSAAPLLRSLLEPGSINLMIPNKRPIGLRFCGPFAQRALRAT